MADDWEELSVGDLVERVRRRIEVQEGEEYPLLGVRLHGVGPYLREVGVGGEIKAKYLYKTQSDDFIYSRLFACKGAFGVISDEFDGHFVSGEFPLFIADSTRVTASYLNLVMCRTEVWEQVERECTGSTPGSRNRWKVERFLSWQVRLPPLQVQTHVLHLVSSLDDYIGDLEAHTANSAALRGALVSDLVDGRHKIPDSYDALLGES